MSASGFGGRTWLFDGFPSPKSGRRAARVAVLLGRGEAFVLYESPHRIGRLMADIAAAEPGRMVCIGREMTKLHEEFIVGKAADVAARFEAGAADPAMAKGEFAVLVSASSSSAAEPEDGAP